MKIKVIAILTAIILIVSYVPVNAETHIPNPPSDGYEYWAVIDYYGDVVLLTSSVPIVVNKNGDRIYAGGPPENTGYNEYAYIEGNWVLTNSGGSMSKSFISIIASNHDIAYNDGSGFFFLRPKVRPLYQTMEATDFGTILRNFSVGLIPIIGCLILVISLRKGWEFLRTQLSG